VSKMNSQDYSHTPVLAKEVIDGLMPKDGAIFVDGTLGGGGHAQEICALIGKDGTFVGIDRDPAAIEAAKKRLEKHECRKEFATTNFDDIREVLKARDLTGIDAGLLDLGVSSHQLDEPARGFSYMHDGPLDMRMAGTAEDETKSAAYVVNEYPEEELERVISRYGEERFAKRVARAIAKERTGEPITTTLKLSEIVKQAIPAATRRDGPHPAKRTFQAIRIEVNDELGSLDRALNAWIDLLNPGGRLAVITFHSLEDRLVKETFKTRENPCICPKGVPYCVCNRKADAVRVNKKPIIPSEQEREQNPRARSAKLRIIEKLK